MAMYWDRTLIELHLELYKRGEYSFIYKTENGINHKMKAAIEALNDNKIEKVNYGGAAGGGKSWLGCSFSLFECLQYEGVKVGVGRAELKQLRESVLDTLKNVAYRYSMKSSQLFNFNGQDNFVEFENGSKIMFKSLEYKPSDPECNDLGSTEYTHVWLEELAGIHPKPASVFKMRFGRFKNTDYGIKPKILQTFNPQKNHVYNDIYLPFKEGRLPDDEIFIQALPKDNPELGADYIRSLENSTDEILRQRLLYGNFDYDDDANALVSYDNIVNSFSNNFVARGDRFITADIATSGSDEAVIGVWEGWVLVHYVVLAKSDGKAIEMQIRQLMQSFRVPVSHVVYDADGVGNYLGSYLVGAKNFVNNGKPIAMMSSSGKMEIPNYANLKSQCEFLLAEKIEKNEIWLQAVVSSKEKELFSQEFSQLKKKTQDDRKLSTLSKPELRTKLGRSPDRMDMVKMRVYFDLEKPQMRLISQPI